MFLLNGKKRKDVTINKVEVSGLAFEGKRAVVVGGTGGLGRAIALQLVTHGAEVTVIGRSFRDTDSQLKFIRADLSTLQSAKEVAEKIDAKDLDLLIFTTGIFSSVKRKVNSEGVELDMAVSYLSRFVIMKSLEKKLSTGSQSKPKVFIMGFPGMSVKASVNDLNTEKSYNAGTAHYNTIIGNESLVHHYAESSEFSCFGLNPGLIKSEIRTGLTGKGSLLTRFIEFMISVLYPDAHEYAKSLLPLFLSEDLDKHSGLMFNRNVEVIQTSKQFKDPQYVSKVIGASEAIVKRALGEEKSPMESIL